MNTQNLKWEVKKRMEAIENCLYWKGRLGRADLINKFGISPQQASADIARYQESAPDNAVFNGSGKYYEPSKSFNPIFIQCDIQNYMEWTGADSSYWTQVIVPGRQYDINILKAITMAIHQHKSIPIVYQSLSQSKATHRVITPHRIIFDGYRYHIRAYCEVREAFRDFVVGRITSVGDHRKAREGTGQQQDHDWNTMVILKIAPHPELTHSQKLIVEHEYGMDNHELKMRVRQATLIYTLTQLHLDRFTQDRTPAEQQIILLNPEVREFLI